MVDDGGQDRLVIRTWVKGMGTEQCQSEVEESEFPSRPQKTRLRSKIKMAGAGWPSEALPRHNPCSVAHRATVSPKPAAAWTSAFALANLVPVPRVKLLVDYYLWALNSTTAVDPLDLATGV